MSNLDKFVEEFPWIVNETSPWAEFKLSLKQSKIALISTGGLYVKGDKPFKITDRKDVDESYREIPLATSADNRNGGTRNGGTGFLDFFRSLSLFFDNPKIPDLTLGLNNFISTCGSNPGFNNFISVFTIIKISPIFLISLPFNTDSPLSNWGTSLVPSVVFCW